MHVKNTSINNMIDKSVWGGTVVAEQEACSKCFAGSVSEKKKNRRYAEAFESAECLLPERIGYEFFYFKEI